MLTIEEIRQLKGKSICSDCFGEECLNQMIVDKGKKDGCSYCGNDEMCLGIGEVTDLIEEALKTHYYRTPIDPEGWEVALSSDRECSYEWERGGYPIIDTIMEATEVPLDAAIDIQRILENKHDDYELAKMSVETEFHEDSFYDHKELSGANWLRAWYEFERDLKAESRFFNSAAASLLQDIFGDIDKLKTSGGDSLVIDAGPGTAIESFFRARVFQSMEALKEALKRPDKSIGPPPAKFALAGRMNAHGISVFYGANKPSVALAEVRPPVGSFAVVVCFKVIRPIKLLDLSAIDEMRIFGSIFDSLFADKLERLAFLRRLKNIITKPVMPNDEALEYTPTQAVADFLASLAKPVFDGILFPSVQTVGDSQNVVLFHKSSRVEEADFPEGTNIYPEMRCADEEMNDFEFVVREEVPAEKPNSKQKDPRLSPAFMVDIEINPNQEYRTSTLQLDCDSVEVHRVSAVKVSADIHRVFRYRSKVGK